MTQHFRWVLSTGDEGPRLVLAHRRGPPCVRACTQSVRISSPYRTIAISHHANGTSRPRCGSGEPDRAVPVVRRRHVHHVRGVEREFAVGAVQQAPDHSHLRAEALSGPAFLQGGPSRDPAVAVVAREAVDVDLPPDSAGPGPVGVVRRLGEAPGAVAEIQKYHRVPRGTRPVVDGLLRPGGREVMSGACHRTPSVANRQGIPGGLPEAHGPGRTDAAHGVHPGDLVRGQSELGFAGCVPYPAR